MERTFLLYFSWLNLHRILYWNLQITSHIEVNIANPMKQFILCADSMTSAPPQVFFSLLGSTWLFLYYFLTQASFCLRPILCLTSLPLMLSYCFTYPCVHLEVFASIVPAQQGPSSSLSHQSIPTPLYILQFLSIVLYLNCYFKINTLHMRELFKWI